MNIIVNIPKRIKYSKINPLEDFYKKCLVSAGKDPDLLGIQVWAFSVNKKDYSKLTALVKKYVKKQYPFLPYKKISFNVSLIMLDIGPKVSNKVPQGFVEINEQELYEFRNTTS